MGEEFHPGQRWVSESEPELGLGSIIKVSVRTVTALFAASERIREYARNNAPLRRVRFRAGDTIENRKGKALAVEAVSERDGLLYYRVQGRDLCETELSDTISFNKPEERLLAGQFSKPAAFELRVAALEHRYQRRQSRVRGFTGGRIDLIPHQLYIASEVTARRAPRVLLADEVGLGKTIEACLILHRLILTGRIQRALILAPESLVHQWFVELLRRFNLWFHIFDEERCAAAETDNPFLEAQCILCSVKLFESEERVEQAVAAGWDMLVVDEAHHLQWSPEKASPEYSRVEALARNTAGLLLLTATPEQLGLAGHFARLRLLDPDRYYSLEAFTRESEQYREVARRADQTPEGPELDALLDRYGPGRVHFRNTRATISGFPKRRVRMHPLALSRSNDPRIDWLVDLLRELAPEKVLLICATPETVAAVETGIRRRARIETAVFHENLSLVQRDRNAAGFAENNGARILLCSEIGSEGRNFQFAHHLVLFDLPTDPELLEQRIGRLDRIGQTSEIQVHAPFVVDSYQEVLALWYQEGLDAFETQIQGGRELLEVFGERVNNVQSRDELRLLIDETRAARAGIAERLHQGRDHLLELHSFRPKAAAALVEEVRREDDDAALDGFMLAVLDRFGIHVQEIAPRTYRLGSAGVLVDSFPGLPAGGFSVTCDRQRALAREDVQFLTWDHPLVTGALDLLLGSEKGNCSAMELVPSQAPAMEFVYVLECVAPPKFHADRFLPPQPLRVTVDCAEPFTGDDPLDLIEDPGFREDLPRLMKQAQERAQNEADGIVVRARQEMNGQLGLEIERLEALQKVNPNVRTAEIDLLAEERGALDEFLGNARLRLDAIRLTQGSRTASAI